MPLYRIKNKLVLFIHIPKAAGFSIHNHLQMIGDLITPYDHYVDNYSCASQHYHADLISQYLNPASVDYIFAVVRNPIERFISEFRYRHREPTRSTRIAPSFLIRKPISHMSETQRTKYFSAWTTKCFTKFHDDPFYLGNHIRPQSEFINVPNIQIFRLEDHLIDLRQSLSEMLGVDLKEFPTDNKSNNLPLKPENHTLERIYTFYKRDFQKLNYSLPSKAFYDSFCS